MAFQSKAVDMRPTDDAFAGGSFPAVPSPVTNFNKPMAKRHPGRPRARARTTADPSSAAADPGDPGQRHRM